MIQRIIKKEILKRLENQKVMLVFGARRVGKTVLLNQIQTDFVGKILKLNGEDNDTLSILENKSIHHYQQLLRDFDLLLIDEAQNIPDIGQKLKLIVDEVSNIKIIATGSSAFDLLNKAGEPLVGRSSKFQLLPFSQEEISLNENTLQTLQNKEYRIIFGSYPEVINLENFERKKEYLQDIVSAYLLKDILMLDGIKNASKMYDLLKLIAFQIGSLVSYNELSLKLGISKNTVEKYMDLLSKVFVIYKISPFSNNLRKEVSKSSKWYFYDTGIRNAIIGNFHFSNNRQDMGHLFENYIINERIKNNANHFSNINFHFWRSFSNQEIDLLEINNQQITAYEIKYGKKKCKIS